jgi:hypothetical protein
VSNDWQPTSTAAVNEIVSKVADPLLVPTGFRSTKPRRWVRSFAPVRHIFEVVAMKGASFVPVWGISLDFVPHVTGERLGWHRTDKSARMDLVYDPIDFDPRWQERSCIGSLRGADATLNDARRVLPAAVRDALGWLDPGRDVASVLGRAEFLRSADRPGRRFAFENYVQQPLAYAFLLARNGSSEKAHEVLDAWITSHGFNAHRTRLTKLLTGE